LLLISCGLVRCSSTGGHLCQRCPSSFVVVVRHGHHCPWVGHHRLGGCLFRVAFHLVIVCGRRVVVCVWCPSFLGVSWVVVVIGGFPRAVCRSWVPGSLCKWVLGLVCGRRHPSVRCWLESRINVACSGATSAVWFLCEKRGGGGCYTAHLDVVSHEGDCGLSLVLNVVGSVIGCGATWAPASCVKKGEGREGGYLPRHYPSSIIDTCCNSVGRRGCAPGLMWTVTMTCIITVWMTWHVC